MAFTIKSILNFNTIEVIPTWVWGENKGNKVKIFRLEDNNAVNSKMTELFTRRLSELLSGKTVELRNPQKVIGEDTIECELFLEGVNVVNYFPDLSNSLIK